MGTEQVLTDLSDLRKRVVLASFKALRKIGWTDEARAAALAARHRGAGYGNIKGRQLVVHDSAKTGRALGSTMHDNGSIKESFTPKQIERMKAGKSVLRGGRTPFRSRMIAPGEPS